ncbi:pentapeptide repeat-containing protein, partial [Klebsiella michiganensis]
ELEHAIFHQATLESCSLVQTIAERADFSAATWLASAAVSESSLIGADFSHATLQQSNLRQTPLQGARFALAKIENSDLS